MALCAATKSLNYIIQVLHQFGEPPSLPITVHEDNKACIQMSESRASSKRTRHIDIKYHYTKG